MSGPDDEVLAARMKVLVLTTDLPYFPGKHGLDFFNVRYLAQQNDVGMVGPLHSFFPELGVRNLEAMLTSSHFWPRPAPAVTLPPLETLAGELRPWIQSWNATRREKLLLRLLQLADDPADAYLQMAVLSNCAHQLIAALAERPWQSAVLIQSSTEPWLSYLPGHLAKFLYFHDVRAHAAARQQQGSLTGDARAVRQQEIRGCRRADVVGFVSALDEERARDLLHPVAETRVSQITVDESYYTPPPPQWRKDRRSVVLFTGHLSHPPNVDAVTFFLRDIWPCIRERAPGAVFQVVGTMPAEDVVTACTAAGPSVELHPNVPDIRPYFWNASAFVVPMRFGGGIRQKILEAWLMRVPVVCTEMAAEGIAAVHEQNCWLENQPTGFAARVAEIMSNGAPEAVLETASNTVLQRNSLRQGGSAFTASVRRSIEVKRARPYRMLFDLRWMEIGQAGGMEQLAYEQIDGIAKIDHRNAYRVLCPRSTYSEWQFPPPFRCQPAFRDRNELRADALHAAVANQLASGLQRQPLLSPSLRALRFYQKLECDLVHSFGYIHPDLAVFPHVFTLCDLQHLHFPEFFTADELKTREHLYRTSAESARHVICISEFTRQDLHRRYGIPLEKITTIWVIPSRAAWIRLEPARGRRLLAGMGLTSDRFLFFPAHCWPHKNHARLLEAFGQLEGELPKDLRLVLTGRPFPADHPARAVLEEHRLQERVVHVGYRSPLELRALYSGARALLFPSLFEGFGIPVAEAMIAGCPVACSNTSSLPEIAGDAAVTFDPADVSDMARAILCVALDENARAELIAAGARRRPLFSSRLQTVKTLAVYRRVWDEFYAD